MNNIPAYLVAHVNWLTAALEMLRHRGAAHRLFQEFADHRRLGENFIWYGCIYHMLQVEKYLYLAHTTVEYSDDDQKACDRNFVKRMEGLVTLDVTEWRTEVQRIEEPSK